MHWQELARFHIRAIGVALACFGIIGAAWQIKLLPATLALFAARQQTNAFPILLMFAPAAMLLLLGGSLFLWGGRLVRRAEQAELSNIRAVERVLFSVLGIYFVADGAITWVRWLAFGGGSVTDLLPTMLQMAIGAALFLGCAGLGVVGRMIAAAIVVLRGRDGS